MSGLEPKYAGENKKFKKITLFLQSGGGILEAAIKIVDIISYYADSFEVIVPMMAKSAATFMSLSADNIYMTSISELGPVDPVIQSPLNPNIQVPARSIKDLISYYSKEQDQKSKTTKDQNNVDKILLSKIENIDPYLLGSYESALEFSKSQIKEKLSSKITDSKTLEDAVHEFTEKHASHSFPITLRALNEYKLGIIVDEEKKIKAIKTLLAVYQGFMAGNSIVKVIGNRDINRNTVIQTQQHIKGQVPSKTSI